MLPRVILIVLFCSQTGRQFNEHYSKVAYIDGAYANVSPTDTKFMNWDTTSATVYFNINSNNDISIKDASGKYINYYNSSHKLVPQYTDALKDTTRLVLLEPGGTMLNLTYYGSYIKLFNPQAKHAVTVYGR